MNEMNKEVLHRMCDKIKLSDTQKEGIMRKINEEVSEKKHRSFNLKRFATVMACALVLVGATIGVEAKFNFIDRISNMYKIWQSGDVELDEKEKAVLNKISLEGGYEFEVEYGKVRVDAIMYDSSFIYFFYTNIANPDSPLPDEQIFAYHLNGIFQPYFIIKGKEYSGWDAFTKRMDVDEDAEGYQGCCVFHVSPLDGSEKVLGFGFEQGDEIIFTEERFVNDNYIRSESLDDIEKIYGTFTLTKPTNTLTFNYDNTEGMEVLETITEIKISPLSITIMGDNYLRKTFPEGIGYTYIESADKIFTIGMTGDEEIDKSNCKYAVSVVKKDGTIVEYGDLGESGAGTATTGNHEYELFYQQHIFDRPLDLSEVDYILVRGWGLEYKIPVNVTE
ncbi:MAG: DUF4179 domain-containing protein [Lachnospiraceae bacterium]|nr:DUF4179 domain-containing protein [Lachnospiraceae bacterium]